MKPFKISLCICTRKFDKKLLNCLRSIKKINIKNTFKLYIIIVFNSKKKISKKELLIIKKLNLKNEIKFLYEKKIGVSHARNCYLKFVSNQKFDFCAFIDDDCIINKNFFLNYLLFIDKENCEIVTGPQLYASKKAYFRVLERNFEYGEKVKWASTNNVFFKHKILKNNIHFSNLVTKYGFGEDQLFFSQQNQLGNIIKWTNNKVYEVIQKNRESMIWFLDRSFKFGLTGFLIDKEIYGRLNGLIINFGKIGYYFYLIIESVFVNIYRPKLIFYNILFNIFRILGRLTSIKNIF